MNVNATPFVPSTPKPEPPASPSTVRRRRQISTKTTKPLQWSDGPLVWIDCEMTGLDPQKDHLLEIAVLITNGNLDIVDKEGMSFIIQTKKEVLDAMTPWCVKQHGDSGLTAACLSSPYTLEYVTTSILEYVQSWVPTDRAALLAGNSVHADRAFLARFMPDLISHLHYRIVDVSTIKELCRRWYPEVTDKRSNSMAQESKHRALDDIMGSIEELRFYRQMIFKDRDEAVTSLAS